MTHTHRLNNTVEEALGSGHCTHDSANAGSSRECLPATAHGARFEGGERPSVIKFNHAEEEHMGRGEHPRA